MFSCDYSDAEIERVLSGLPTLISFKDNTAFFSGSVFSLYRDFLYLYRYFGKDALIFEKH